ncbi:MAG: HWE histidine kinase domain-containing protein [Phycisphaerales bacterium]|jgi:two-component sensor histidine kinase|nr:HWE histidine kinase domain-containing protein [Phycisphaerales bacterium]
MTQSDAAYEQRDDDPPAGSLQASMLGVSLMWLVFVVVLAALVLSLIGERQIAAQQRAEATLIGTVIAGELVADAPGGPLPSEAQTLSRVRTGVPEISRIRLLSPQDAEAWSSTPGGALVVLPDGRGLEVVIGPQSTATMRLLNSIGTLAGLGILFLLMAVFLVVIVGRYLGRPLREVRDRAARLASGDLSKSSTPLERAGQFSAVVTSLEAARVRMAEDESARVAADEELRRTNSLQRLMLRELNHRIRNNLASLTSLIAISRTQAEDVPEFARRIQRRVEAMASAHALLSERHWAPVAVRTLLERLSPAECVERMRLQGGDVQVGAAQATALAMVLQEMFANAMEHGGLGAGSGWLTVEWDVAEGPSGPTLVIQWSETGGPGPDPNAEAGTGTTLIRGLVEGELRGVAHLQHTPTGVSHQLRIPLTPDASTGVV